jgi:hypothetical protein
MVPPFDRCMTFRFLPHEFPEDALKCRKINQSAFSIFFAMIIDYSCRPTTLLGKYEKKHLPNFNPESQR